MLKIGMILLLSHWILSKIKVHISEMKKEKSKPIKFKLKPSFVTLFKSFPYFAEK